MTKRFGGESEKCAVNSTEYYYIYDTNKLHLCYYITVTIHLQSVYNFIFILRYWNAYYDLTLKLLGYLYSVVVSRQYLF
jgi:hypothetical protein